jgi:hypothetical protein
MNLVIQGYFNRIDGFGNLRLVNLAPESMQKLENCGKHLYPKIPEHNSPILPNGAVIKPNPTAMCYDIDGVPASTGSLIGQLVEVKTRVKKYSMYGKPGWNMKLVSITPVKGE